MKTLIKNTASKLAIAGTKLASRAFEVTPVSQARIAVYKANPTEFENKSLGKFIEVNETFGKLSFITFVVSRKRKPAHSVSLAGFLISTTHIYDYFNVKYHANKK